jgi:hypothetical protein
MPAMRGRHLSYWFDHHSDPVMTVLIRGRAVRLDFPNREFA